MERVCDKGTEIHAGQNVLHPQYHSVREEKAK